MVRLKDIVSIIDFDSTSLYLTTDTKSFIPVDDKDNEILKTFENREVIGMQSSDDGIDLILAIG